MNHRLVLVSALLIAILFAGCAVRTASSPPLSGDDSPEYVQALFEKGEANYRNNLKNKALEYYFLIVERYPQSKQAAPSYYKIGRIHMDKNDYEKAIHYFKLLVSQHPETPYALEAHYQLGQCYFKQGKYDLALQALGYYTNVRDAKRQPKARRLMGDAYFKTEKYGDALLAYAAVSASLDRPEQVELLKQTRILVEQHLSTGELLTLIPRMADGPVADFTRYRVGQELMTQGKRADASKVLRDINFSKRKYKFYDKAAKLLEMAESPGVAPSAGIPTGRDEIVMPAAPERSEAKHSIGVLLPLSGKRAVFGREVLHGIMQGVELFGSRRGAPFKVVLYDTQGNPEEAVKGVEELSNDPSVMAIIGPLLGSCAPAAAEAAERRRVPLITLTTREKIADGGRWAFRNFLTASLQVKALINYATQYQGAFRFAVLYPDNHQGKLYRDLFAANLDPNRNRLVASVAYGTDETDFRNAIRQLTAAGQFDALFIPDNHRRVALIAPQLVYYGVKDVALLGTNAWNHDDLARNAGSYLSKAVIVDGFFARAANPEVTEFVEGYRRTFNDNPTFLSAVGYDTARMLAYILNRAPDMNSREVMRRELLSLQDFPGATGELTMGENRETNRRLYLLRVGETRIEEMF